MKLRAFENHVADETGRGWVTGDVEMMPLSQARTDAGKSCIQWQPWVLKGDTIIIKRGHYAWNTLNVWHFERKDKFQWMKRTVLPMGKHGKVYRNFFTSKENLAQAFISEVAWLYLTDNYRESKTDNVEEWEIQTHLYWLCGLVLNERVIPLLRFWPEEFSLYHVFECLELC